MIPPEVLRREDELIELQQRWKLHGLQEWRCKTEVQMPPSFATRSRNIGVSFWDPSARYRGLFQNPGQLRAVVESEQRVLHLANICSQTQRYAWSIVASDQSCALSVPLERA